MLARKKGAAKVAPDLQDQLQTEAMDAAEKALAEQFGMQPNERTQQAVIATIATWILVRGTQARKHSCYVDDLIYGGERQYMIDKSEKEERALEAARKMAGEYIGADVGFDKSFNDMTIEEVSTLCEVIVDEFIKQAGYIVPAGEVPF
jgi:hypothetical protein